MSPWMQKCQAALDAHVGKHVAAGYTIVSPVTLQDNGVFVASLKRKGKTFVCHVNSNSTPVVFTRQV